MIATVSNASQEMPSIPPAPAIEDPDRGAATCEASPSGCHPTAPVVIELGHAAIATPNVRS